MEKVKLLIVEDETIIAQSLGKELDHLDYDVFQLLFSGEEVLEMTKKEKLDLVIMDIKLQGDMDGIETAGKIKQWWGIPVIFVTGYSDPEIREKAEVTEEYEYLIKPFGIHQLKACIEMALKKQHPRH